MQHPKLNPFQLELRSMYSFNPKKEDLLVIRSFLAKYFSERRSVGHMEENISEEDLDRWINE